MKVEKLQFGFMTNTIKRPIVHGTIYNAVCYQKGEGNYCGRLPAFYVVCSDDTTVEHHTQSRTETRVGMSLYDISKIYTIATRDEESAQALAAKMALSPFGVKPNTIYLAPDGHVRFAPKLMEGDILTIKQKEHPDKTVRVVKHKNDYDSCNQCIFHSCFGCLHPLNYVHKKLCGHEPGKDEFLALELV